MLPYADKTAQRALGKAARRALSPAQRAAYSRDICALLAADPRVKKAKTVLTYSALPTEADPSALHAALLAAGAGIAYPRCTAPGVMEARIPTDDAPFTPDACGIPAPDALHSRAVPPEELDIVLTPLTVFDAECRRCGMGAGFYDRYLPICRRALFFGLAFSAQQAEKVDCGPTDTRLHAVFTEKGVFEACKAEENKIK